ncbi:hypothetical protein FANTH_13105 [Fusarium anthophilum]|uniref:Vegetative incompatibility protein HET-E-1 n=1 Tax=Fusarium anthophilum TaxID=48485 RepID=A0A8H4YPT9_9HYPO|nr:hypothetical protein FANTH_13105 [Fusarium anthophilum]
MGGRHRFEKFKKYSNGKEAKEEPSAASSPVGNSRPPKDPETITDPEPPLVDSKLALVILVSELKKDNPNDDSVSLGSSHEERWRQMQRLVQIGLSKTEKEAKIYEKVDDGLELFGTVRALVEPAVSAVPQAAIPRATAFLKSVVNIDYWSGKLKDIEAGENKSEKHSQQYNTTESRERLQTLIIGVKSIEKAIDRQTEQQKKLNKDERNRLCLRALYTTNPIYDKERIEEEKSGLLSHCHSWIFLTEGFQTWQQDPDCRLLWIRGDPGKGKAMLLCGIIDRLDETTPGLISCFFCQATGNHQNSATAVLRGIIWSLAHQHPALVSYVRSEFDSAGEQAFNGPNNWEILSSILRRMISGSSNRVPEGTTMVIDALDECTKDNKKLIDVIVDICADKKSQVRRIISSHNWVEFQDAFIKKTVASQRVIVSLEDNEQVKESISKAIDAFIKYKVEELERIKETKLEAEVHDILAGKSSSTFFWVALAFAALVHRPLSLAELSSSVQSIYQHSNRPDALKKQVLRYKGFLVVMGDVVSFMHQSAKDFLLEDQLAKEFIWDVKKEEQLSESILRGHHTILIAMLEKMRKTLKYDLLKDLARGTKYHELISVLRDINRFALYFKGAIEQFPLQTYVSGLFFSPRTSLARQAFKQHTFGTSWVRVPVSEDWSACVQTLEGHTSTESNMAFSGNGQWLASTSQDYTIRIWDVATGVCLQTITSPHVEHLKTARSNFGIPSQRNSSNTQTVDTRGTVIIGLAFSPDGELIASCSSEPKVQIRNAKTGDCIYSITVEQRLPIGPEIRFSFSSDSRRILLGSEQPGIRDIAGCKWTEYPDIYPERLLTSAFHSDRTWVGHVFGEHGHSIWRFSETNSHRVVDLLRDDGYALPPSGQYPAGRPLPTSQRPSAISNDGTQVATCTEYPFRLAIADTTTGVVAFASPRYATAPVVVSAMAMA